MTPQPNYVLIDTDAKKALFSPMQEADEVGCGHGEWLRVGERGGFHSVTTYRRLERNAWLPIKDKPVQYPAWLLHKDPRNETKWFGKCPLVGGDEGLMLVKYTHWLPAPPAPEGPVNEDGSNLPDDQKLVAFDFFISGWKEGADAKLLLADAIAHAKRESQPPSK